MENKLREKAKEPFIEKEDDSLIICRCEEITKGEIRKAIYDGMKTMNELKRYLRAGMGLCQGQTCNRIVRSILAQELGVTPTTLNMPTPRPPARPISMINYAKDNVIKKEDV